MRAGRKNGWRQLAHFVFSQFATSVKTSCVCVDGHISELLFSPLALPLKFDWEYVCIPGQRGEGEASPLADWSGVIGVMEATKSGRFGRRVKAVFLPE